MTSPELVIFDCDGVLVDSERLANEVLARALARYGLPLTIDECMAMFVGLSMAAVVDKANALIDGVLPDDFLVHVQADTFAAFRGRVQPVDGVETLIRSVREAGLKTCVASSGSFDKMDVTLLETGLKGYFEGCIYSASQVERGKPYPDLFLFAADQMNVAPQRCLVIEDSRFGIEAAVRANMRALAYAPSGNLSAFEGEGVQMVRTMSEVAEYLGV